MALNKVLTSCEDLICNARVDALVDNRAVIHAWNNQGCRSSQLNKAMKTLFNSTIRLNVMLHLSYVPSKGNPADAPSRRMSTLDSRLTEKMWLKVQLEFGGREGNSCDLMALDSNVMKDKMGDDLPHFTPGPSPNSSGVNLFAQCLSQHKSLMERPYVFPPSALVGPVMRFLEEQRQACTIVVLDLYPRKHWWPLLLAKSNKKLKLDSEDDVDALQAPSKQGWVPRNGIKRDLWAFAFSAR